jgi:4-methoxybenzoate monooxygenase (O-demethylating)
MEVPALDFDPFEAAALADPYAWHDRLRDAGPVVWLPAIGTYALARYAQVQPALKDWQTFTSGRGVGLADFAREEPWRPPSLLLEADPPLHDRTRALMNKVASLASLRTVMPEWQVRADALVELLLAKRRIDAVAELGEAFPLLVFPDLIGLRDNGREHLQRLWPAQCLARSLAGRRRRGERLGRGKLPA